MLLDVVFLYVSTFIKANLLESDTSPYINKISSLKSNMIVFHVELFTNKSRNTYVILQLSSDT